ncbi:MAG: DUF1554 domain-containing protein, partial [Thermomicrobiales bacterium]
GLEAAAAALLLVVAAPAPGAAKQKKKTFCLNGETVKAKHKKKKNRLKRQGATRGACPCPSGQQSCNGVCIASTACCTTADCASPDICYKGACVPLQCGTGGPCTVFVSGVSTDGGLISGAAADAMCQSYASTASLPGTYKAYLSDSVSTPATRFTNTADAGPYVLVANTALDGSNPPPTVAATFAALTRCDGGDCLQHTINRIESGAEIGPVGVWTGTLPTGAASTLTCLNWTSTSNSDLGTSGTTVNTDSGWSSAFSDACDNAYALYCFEQA